MLSSELFDWLSATCKRPEPFSRYTTIDMWNDDHVSEHMLAAHLDVASDLASRNLTFIRRSSEWMKAYFGIAPQTRIMDFGCGPGLYAAEWARMGAEVSGIDASKRSIEYAIQSAHRENLPIRYVNGDYLEHSFAKRYDLITMIFCDYCALGPAQRQRLHMKWNAILKPGGHILFDVHSIMHFDSISESRSLDYYSNGFWSSKPHYVFRNAYRYDCEQLLLTQFVVVEPNRIRTFYNWLQCFSTEKLHAELRKAGFKVKETFGSIAGDPVTADAKEIAVVVENAT
jgi:SAM-dependent methyltransferase